MNKYNDFNFMDDNFKCFYKILRYLEKHLDDEEIDLSPISAEALRVSKIRWIRYMQILYDAEYIKGIDIFEDLDGLNFANQDICITLKGLEYLSENEIMQRIYKGSLKVKSLIK